MRCVGLEFWFLLSVMNGIITGYFLNQHKAFLSNAKSCFLCVEKFQVGLKRKKGGVLYFWCGQTRPLDIKGSFRWSGKTLPWCLSVGQGRANSDKWLCRHSRVVIGTEVLLLSPRGKEAGSVPRKTEGISESCSSALSDFERASC